MRIAVNTRLLLPNRLEGLGTFTHETLKRMVVQHPEHEFIFIFDRPYDKRFVYAENVTPVYAGPPARHALLFIYWFEFVIPRVLRKYKADIFLSPDGYLSLNTDVKQLPVIHDLNFEHHPEFFGLANRLHYKYFFPRYAKKAVRIATVSEFSKNDIASTYGINPEKIDVVYNGVDEIFKPATEDEKKKIKEEYSEGKDYFIFVGGLYLRKNLKTALLAFDKFKTETQSDIKFLIAGQKHKESEELFHVHSNLKNRKDVIFLGRVEPRHKVPELIGASLALIYISWFEGFGLPIAEAMKCETAVLTSDITAMPEISDGAAILVDPYNFASVADGMKKIISDKNIRDILITKGREVVKNYTWNKTSNLLWNSLVKT